MKYILSLLTIIFFVKTSFSQTTNYSRCNCKETISETHYTLECNGVIMEEGQFKEGKRTGAWIAKNSNGSIIIRAQYLNGKLNGKYEQFHFKGNPKLTAHFLNGLPDQKWTYFNEKGKIIKEGVYNNGEPKGIWKVFDKKGKKVIAEYDFDNRKALLPNGDERIFSKNAVAREDERGGWMVLGFPDRHITSKKEPLGGYLLAGDFFIDYMNIPLMFFDTYIHYEFLAKLKVLNDKVEVVEIIERNKSARFDNSKPSLPFLARTDPPGKLSGIEPSKESLELLKNRIKEVVSLSGPWITNGFEGEFEIQIPFVLNDFKE